MKKADGDTRGAFVNAFGRAADAFATGQISRRSSENVGRTGLTSTHCGTLSITALGMTGGATNEWIKIGNGQTGIPLVVVRIGRVLQLADALAARQAPRIDLPRRGTIRASTIECCCCCFGIVFCFIIVVVVVVRRPGCGFFFFFFGRKLLLLPSVHMTKQRRRQQQ
eukprot:scaffold1501_cov158-Amphora_coffeaeformis.AAC.9